MKVYGYFLLTLVCACHSEVERQGSLEDRERLVVGLDSSFQSLLHDIGELSIDQWRWKKDTNSWSIAQVVEHLIVHDELFYREVRVLTGLPQMSPVPRSSFAPDDEILS